MSSPPTPDTATHPTIRALYAAPPRALGVFTDSSGTTRVVLPRTFHPPPTAHAHPSPSTASIVHRGAPFSRLYLDHDSLDRRSIVVFLAGNARGGAAVFFGPRSPHNVAERLVVPGTTGTTTRRSPGHPERRAQLHALERALSIIRSSKVRRAHGGGGGGLHTVVLATDSEYIVRALTEGVYEWRGNGWRDADGEGEIIDEAEKVREVDRGIERLGREGVDVEFWRVGRGDNGDALGMAEAVVTRVCR